MPPTPSSSASSRANTSASEFRTVLQRMKDLENLLKDNKREISEVHETAKIIDGNQSTFADEVIDRMKEMERKLSKTIEEKFEALEHRLTDLEESRCVNNMMTSTPVAGEKRRLERNPGLSHHVRSKIAAMDFEWETTKKITDPVNRRIKEAVLKEVMEVEDIQNDPMCTVIRIEQAISSTFKTAKKNKQRSEKGGEETFRKEARRAQRKARKLKTREKFLDEEEKENLLATCLHSTLISSEESEDDSPDLVIRPLHWRSEEVGSFMKQLDRRSEEQQLKDRRRQNASRKDGEFSDRSQEGVPEHLKWAIREFPNDSE